MLWPQIRPDGISRCSRIVLQASRCLPAQAEPISCSTGSTAHVSRVEDVCNQTPSDVLI